MRSGFPIVVALCGSVAVGAGACGGAQRGLGDGGVYRDGPVAFRIGSAPSGWRRIDVSDAALAWRDDAHDASVLVNGRCGSKDDDTPLSALTNHLIMGTTEREFVREDTIPFDGREARHSVLKAKLDGVAMTFDIFVEKKNGCVYDLVYVARPDAFDGGAPEFERFVSGFHAFGDAQLEGS